MVTTTVNFTRLQPEIVPGEERPPKEDLTLLMAQQKEEFKLPENFVNVLRAEPSVDYLNGGSTPPTATAGTSGAVTSGDAPVNLAPFTAPVCKIGGSIV